MSHCYHHSMWMLCGNESLTLDATKQDTDHKSSKQTHGQLICMKKLTYKLCESKFSAYQTVKVITIALGG